MEWQLESEKSKQKPQSMPDLVSKLSRDHSRFLENLLPGLRSLAVQSHNYTLARFLENMSDELLIHFRMEERLVFPLILSRLEHTSQAIEPALRLACDHMREDHRTHMKHLKVLQAFRDQIARESANKTESGLYVLLETFCAELQEHSDLENKTLFRSWPMLEDQTFPGSY